ncbi:MAG: DUF420 domain-containing protein [Gemmatimonadetes bacterium]|nr:DUF420 domain-containing protein [Gemmatimonadota bacterium]
MIDPHHLPVVNACLNGIAAVLLVVGFAFVRRGKIPYHKACMGTAVGVSALFLVSYLFYHSQVGSIRFTAQGWPRPIYFTILITHTVLAVAVLPLVLVTLGRALRGRFDRHARIARWTLPVWLYVSVTGVLVYLLLYRWFPSAELG